MNSVPATCGKSRAAVVIFWMAAVLVAAYGVGFFFHTCFDPIVFGKYDLRYCVFLAAWYLVLVPCTFFVVRFLVTTSEIRLSRGRTGHVRPRTKIVALVIVALVGYLAVETIARKILASRTLTHAEDVFHPYLQNTPRPSNPAFHTNRWGFRGEEIEKQKPPGTFRIFVFGGSAVFCERAEFEATHCRIMEKKLRAAYPDVRIEVQNAGAEWHCSQHSVMKLLFKVQEFQPDLVIIWHAINDLVRSFESDAFCERPYENDYGHYDGPVINLRRPRQTLAYLIQSSRGHWMSDFRFDRVRVTGLEGKGIHAVNILFFPKAQPIEVTEWPSLAAFTRNMRDFVAIAQSKGIRVMMATQPSLFREDLTPEEREVLIFSVSHQFQGQMASLASMTRGMAQFNAATRKIAADADVPMVDLDKLVPKTLEYLHDDVHYTAKGNELIGKALADEVVREGIIRR